MERKGKEQRIAITASSGLDKSEVDRMVKDAQAHASEDKTRRELIDARVRLLLIHERLIHVRRARTFFRLGFFEASVERVRPF